MAGYRFELKSGGAPWEWSRVYRDQDSAQRERRELMRLPHIQVGPVEPAPAPPTAA
jgi:hypothetical protein